MATACLLLLWVAVFEATNLVQQLRLIIERLVQPLVSVGNKFGIAMSNRGEIVSFDLEKDGISGVLQLTLHNKERLNLQLALPIVETQAGDVSAYIYASKCHFYSIYGTIMRTYLFNALHCWDSTSNQRGLKPKQHY